MGRPRGGKNRNYTVEEKLKIVRMRIEQHNSINEISRLTGISEKNISRWVNQYILKGIDGLMPKKKTGNPFSALHSSKKLTREERLELENLKLRIENERLKKGYLVKGGGVNKEYVTISDANTRSSRS